MSNIMVKHLKVNILIPAFSILIFSVLLFTLSAASAAQDEVKKIQKAYEDIKDMSGSFIQKSYIKDLNRTDIFTGQFFIKMPMKMKWDYKGEDPQEVSINNDEIIIYQKKEKQAFRSKFDRETYGQAPIALLGGFGKIQEEFLVSGKNDKLLLKPKKPTGNIVSIEIILSEHGFPISSFIIYDLYSNRIEIALKDIKINTGIEDKMFEISFPEGVSIYEYNP
ncbi:MAG: outer membrane lipoprotein carrier protein LolA [Nitrospirae bacterium]|jgi:outer membrane lipoprotein carrier protein|nr:outer membrane lipoprotein carrier protein LolA [Nitrospirota bacterium]